MAEITVEYVDDTCPVCESTVRVPKTGTWANCPREHCRGRLRWKEEEADEHAHARLLTAAERTHLLRLRTDLAELDRWVEEAVPGARRIAKQIREQLEQLAGETTRKQEEVYRG